VSGRSESLAIAAAALIAAGVLACDSSGSAAAADRDCSDFANQRDAQNFFLSHGGPSHDPDHLDSDGDGIACESNPCPCEYTSGGGGSRPPERIRARILHVVDGDTLRVSASGTRRKRYDVRLIGIDTPEKYGRRECGSSRASRAMRRRAPRGLRVRLVTDPTQDLFDRYGRLLAYVVRRRDGVDLGKAQLAHGWARVYVFDRPFRRLSSYRRAARRARHASRGAWRLCDGHFHQPLGRRPARRQ
jgi:endonuclease YncB( thermonuclease family)